METLYTYYFAVARWAIAFFCILLGFLWVKYFKKSKPSLNVLAELTTSDGISIPITSKENIIGRGKRADILIPLGTVHTKHAVLFVKNKNWFLAPLDGKISVNLQNLTKPAPLYYGDKITIAKQNLIFRNKKSNPLPQKENGGVWLLLTLTVIQLLVFIEIMLRLWKEFPLTTAFVFGGLIVSEWVYFTIGRLFKNFTVALEIPILFMLTFGFAVISTTNPEDILKQFLCFLAGGLGFLLLQFLLKFPEALQQVQRVVMVLSLLLLYYTAFFGTVTGGARNWLSVGGFSFQPSEICKPAFVFCGGATLYNIIKKPKMKLEFIIYSVLSMGALAIMYDFGAVAIFFVGMLMVLTLRLMKPVFVFLITGGATIFAGAVILIFPYVAKRFGVWLHAWDYVDTLGYQQTRTMIAAASGGLLGVGGGNGYLAGVSASDTDLVFGILCEEWGTIAAIAVALCIVAISACAIRFAKNADSAFYAVCSLTAAVMIVFQSALNIFGSLDILPLTGVTLIFVSRGGTSIISAMLMMSFLKSAQLNKRVISQWRYEDEMD